MITWVVSIEPLTTPELTRSTWGLAKTVHVLHSAITCTPRFATQHFVKFAAKMSDRTCWESITVPKSVVDGFY
jgi:hypothetical protein